MPRMPTAEDIGLRTPRVGGGVVSADLTAVPQAFGRSADLAIRYGQQIEQADDEFAIALAETEFAIGQERALAELQDDDYETYGERYQEKIAPLREKANVLKDPRDQRILDLQIEKLIARGELEVQARAKLKREDRGRASLQNALTQTRAAALASTDPYSHVERVNALIEGAVRQGLIDADAGQQERERFSVDVATAGVGMMPPQARIEALSSDDPVIQIIPLDVRAKMKEQAEDEIRARESHDYMMGQRQKQADFESALESIRVSPERGLGAVRPEVLNALSPAEQQSLAREASRVANGHPLVTDIPRRDKLFNMLADRTKWPEISRSMNIAEYKPYLSEEDYAHAESTYLSIRGSVTGAEAEADAKVGTAADHQAVSERLNGAIVSVLGQSAPVGSGKEAVENEDYGKVLAFRSIFWDEYNARARELGVEKLPREQVTDILSTLSRDVINKEDRGWLKRLYTPDQVKVFDTEVPEDLVPFIEEDLRAQGRVVTPEAVKGEYIFTYRDVEDIPEEDRAAIEQELSKRGLPVTGDNMLKLFRAGQTMSGVIERNNAN